MNPKYLRYYDSYSGTTSLRFLWDSLFARPTTKKHSILNRMRDYPKLQRDPARFDLHRKINQTLYESATQWDSYDYGEGYCYQSLDLIGMSGLRDTGSRVDAMGLRSLLKDKTVLDIGFNSGYLALSIADAAKSIKGCDINPYLVEIGQTAAEFLALSNVELTVSTFEELEITERVDAVLSFANHSTFDGNTEQSIEQYFDKCQDRLNPGGSLLFESHNPDYEGEAVEAVCAIIESRFEILDRNVLDYGTRMDRGRIFIVARAR